ncbi:MAG TPA: DUF3106 domain-containing protein [Candidatus Polarisedimenticolia bacterium]|nr:DUF3106 domain-containing protein [Candidatus Polarisedimenticolia bacterium]
MRRKMLIFLPVLLLVTGFVAQPASAQGRGQQQSRQADNEAAQQERVNGNPESGNGVRPDADGAAGEGRPNPRAGLPPRWLDRIRNMSPEEQERFLQNNRRFQALPQDRQDQIRRNLQNWNSLSPKQRAAIRNRERIFERMTPEQRQYVRQSLLPRWQQLPIERRQAIRGRLRLLQRMTRVERAAALDDPRFMRGLSPEEQSLLRDLNLLRNPPDE